MLKAATTGLLPVLLLPALVLGDIHVNLRVSGAGSEPSVDYFGSDVAIISDQEAQTFKLVEYRLKKAAEKYYDSTIQYVWIRDPTPPWDNFYKTYGFEEITRTLVPKRVTIIRTSSESVVVAKSEFVNNSTHKAKYNAAITQQVENTITHTWTKGGELTIDNSISYGINIYGFSLGGSENSVYTSHWGSDTSKSQMFLVGSSSGVEVELGPGETVITTLTANRATIAAKVEYSATLSGLVAARYYWRYKGHYLWGLPVAEVQELENLPREVSSSEVIRIGFYSDVRVTVSDLYTNQTIKSEPGLLL